MQQCYWPLTRCPKCNEQYCEKCEQHTCPEWFINRYLFVSLMRRPEMALLRHALTHLKMDTAVDWRKLKDFTIESHDSYGPFDPFWRLDTNEFGLFVWLRPNTEIDWASFEMYWDHVEDGPCKCYFCS